MRTRWIASLLALELAMGLTSASASAQVLSGELDDSTNPALVAGNLGAASFADGFTALGTPGSLGNTYYHVVVATAVPEAASWALLLAGLLAGLLAVGWAKRCKQLLTPKQHQCVFFSGPHE